jgi:hypothetical protein
MQEQQGSKRSTSLSEEFKDAMIEKIVNLGADIERISEQIHKLPDPTAALGDFDKRVGELTQRLGQLGDNLGKVGDEFGKISQRLSLPVASIDRLSQQLTQHALLFEKPLKKSVHYTHFLGRSMLVGTVLFIMIVGLTILWNRTQIKANQHAENDIKWRQAKLTPDSLVLKALDKTDRAYLADPDGFRKAVIDEEERREELFEQWQHMQQVTREIEHLEEEGKKKGSK